MTVTEPAPPTTTTTADRSVKRQRVLALLDRAGADSIVLRSHPMLVRESGIEVLTLDPRWPTAATNGLDRPIELDRVVSG